MKSAVMVDNKLRDVTVILRVKHKEWKGVSFFEKKKEDVFDCAVGVRTRPRI